MSLWGGGEQACSVGVCPEESFNPIENGGTAEKGGLASSPTSA